MAVTVTTKGKQTKLKCTWTSDGSGDATVSIADYSAFQLISFQSFPGTGADAPTANYSITLIDDETSNDIMCGETTGNRSNSGADVDTISSVPILPITGSMTLTISGAGAANTGVVNLVLKQIT